MKIPFDIDTYRAHPEMRVETGRGENVRILTTNMKSDFPILAIIEDAPDHEDYDSFTLEGKNSKTLEDSNNDLFIVTDEPELTKFENRLAEIIDYARLKKQDVSSEEIVEDAKRLSPELLSLAREQLIHEGHIIENHFNRAVEKVEPEVMKEVEAACELALKIADEVQYRKGQYDVFLSVYPIDTPDTHEEFGKRRQGDAVRAYNKGYEEGKLAALKDLPRWTRFANGYYGEPSLSMHVNTGKRTIEYNGRWIYLDDVYKALPVDD